MQKDQKMIHGAVNGTCLCLDRFQAGHSTEARQQWVEPEMKSKEMKTMDSSHFSRSFIVKEESDPSNMA